MALRTLQDLYVEQLQDLYSAGDQLCEALPKMAEAASDDTLKRGFHAHLDQTKEQRERVRGILTKLGADPEGETCQAMRGLVLEGEEMIEMEAEPEVRDAGLIAAAQRIAHYQIAGYGTVTHFAEKLGREEDKAILGQTLQEEKDADAKLIEAAKRGFVARAV